MHLFAIHPPCNARTVTKDHVLTRVHRSAIGSLATLTQNALIHIPFKSRTLTHSYISTHRHTRCSIRAGQDTRLRIHRKRHCIGTHWEVEETYSWSKSPLQTQCRLRLDLQNRWQNQWNITEKSGHSKERKCAIYGKCRRVKELESRLVRVWNKHCCCEIYSDKHVESETAEYRI